MQKEILISLFITALISAGAYNLIQQDSIPQNNLRSNGILQEFENWKIEHNINFKSIEEEIFRRKVYENNVKMINQVNSEQGNFTLKANHFAHMTNEEFAEIYLHEKEYPRENQILRQTLQDQYAPQNFTWKGKGVLTPVQNEGFCDASYAFSTIGMMEAYYVLNNRKQLTKFSEQQLISCNNFGAGCKGGNVEKSINFYIDNTPVNASLYPYTSQNGYIPVCNTTQNGVPGFILGGWIYSQYNPPQGQGVSQLRKAISQRPVSSGIDGHKLRFYQGGIFNYCGNDRNIDMLVTGYTKKYWELKAPFGPAWGENGYLRLTMGDTCGITTQFYNVGS